MQVSDLTHKAPLGKSDHQVLSFNFHCYMDYGKPKDRFLFQKGDFNAMRNNLTDAGWKDQFLAIASQNTKNPSRVESFWKSFKTKILELRDAFVPKIVVSNRPSWREKGSFPIDERAREAIKNKNRKHRAWMSAITFVDRENTRMQYVLARNKAKTLLRKPKRLYEKGIAVQCKRNPKSFWAYTRSSLVTIAYTFHQR